jgi:2-polyprenyl-3-methyl-5-hydroxy-6-metoxy-1,4-benzoquinol methylase
MTAPIHYRYAASGGNASHDYLLPVLRTVLSRSVPKGSRLFDLGCGNGHVASCLERAGYTITGIDASSEGIEIARKAYPQIRLEMGSVYEDLAKRFGLFDAVVSLEVVEHLYDPRRFVKTAYDLLSPGGVVVISTPYHGYLKNLLLALTGRWDAHFTALWDHGHIKFWSVRTLSALLAEVGFHDLDFAYAGRIRPLAKSMFAVARK